MKWTAGRPNLFIVGAPKCGSTSVYHYLKAHPRVFMSGRKGPGFFLSEWETCEENMERYRDLLKMQPMSIST